MKIIKKVGQGEMLPPFYGIAWREYVADRVVCLPIPLNLLASVLRSAWAFCKHGGRYVPACPREAYEQGRREAIKRG